VVRYALTTKDPQLKKRLNIRGSRFRAKGLHVLHTQRSQRRRRQKKENKRKEREIETHFRCYNIRDSHGENK